MKLSPKKLIRPQDTGPSIKIQIVHKDTDRPQEDRVVSHGDGYFTQKFNVSHRSWMFHSETVFGC